MNFCKRILVLLLALSLVIVPLASCSESGDPTEATTEGSTEPNDPVVQANKRVLLVSIDGLRSDALLASPYAERLLQASTAYTAATTVYPSVTLPCHMSMHHGVSPTVHGVLDNSYTPAEMLTDGIAETLAKVGKTCAYFYNWGPLGDVIDEGALVKHEYVAGETLGWAESNEALARACKDYLAANDTDFTFLYLGHLDEMGHQYGWLSAEYNEALHSSLTLMLDLVDTLSEDYTVILTTDHGGHGNGHGSELAEDMTIPILLMGADFAKGTSKEGGSILDVAPTVADLLGVLPVAEWEGTSLK